MFELVAVIVIAVVEVVGIVHQNHEDARHAENTTTFSAPREENPAQSWDQENLKRNDAGCPTAIWIAPAGTLEQCK